MLSFLRIQNMITFAAEVLGALALGSVCLIALHRVCAGAEALAVVPNVSG